MTNGRCRIYSGKTPKGIASPHFKTGAHSKYLPRVFTENNSVGQSEKLGQLLKNFANALTEPFEQN